MGRRHLLEIVDFKLIVLVVICLFHETFGMVLFQFHTKNKHTKTKNQIINTQFLKRKQKQTVFDNQSSNQDQYIDDASFLLQLPITDTISIQKLGELAKICNFPYQQLINAYSDKNILNFISTGLISQLINNVLMQTSMNEIDIRLKALKTIQLSISQHVYNDIRQQQDLKISRMINYSQKVLSTVHFNCIQRQIHQQHLEKNVDVSKDPDIKKSLNIFIKQKYCEDYLLFSDKQYSALEQTYELLMTDITTQLLQREIKTNVMRYDTDKIESSNQNIFTQSVRPLQIIVEDLPEEAERILNCFRLWDW